MLNIVNKWLSVTSLPLSFALFFLQLTGSYCLVLSSDQSSYLDLLGAEVTSVLPYTRFLSFALPFLSLLQGFHCVAQTVFNLSFLLSQAQGVGFTDIHCCTLCSHCCLNAIVQTVKSASQWEADSISTVVWPSRIWNMSFLLLPSCVLNMAYGLRVQKANDVQVCRSDNQ